MQYQLRVLRGGLSVFQEGTYGPQPSPLHVPSPLRQEYARLVNYCLARREELLAMQHDGKLTLEELGERLRWELLPLEKKLNHLRDDILSNQLSICAFCNRPE